MRLARLLIYSFIITACYDVILHHLSLNYDRLPKWLQEYKFIGYLTPYFKKHTLLGAALIAGFVGFGAQLIILHLRPFPDTQRPNIKDLLSFMALTFIVSALYGFPMKASKLFPYLTETYYKKLGPWAGMYHDGTSGLIVQVTLYMLLYLRILR
jgi:hypothetical protein